MIKTFLKFVFFLTIVLLAGSGQLHNHAHAQHFSLYSVDGVEILNLNDGPQAVIKSSSSSREWDLQIDATETEVEESEVHLGKRYLLQGKYLAAHFYVHLPWCFSHPFSQSLAFSEHFPSSLSFRSLYHKFEVFRI